MPCDVQDGSFNVSRAISFGFGNCCQLQLLAFHEFFLGLVSPKSILKKIGGIVKFLLWAIRECTPHLGDRSILFTSDGTDYWQRQPPQITQSFVQIQV